MSGPEFKKKKRKKERKKNKKNENEMKLNGIGNRVEIEF